MRPERAYAMGIHADAHVEVIQTFKSDMICIVREVGGLHDGEVIRTFKSQCGLRKGMIGIVREVDGDGDANVKFPEYEQMVWIISCNFNNIKT